MVFCENFVLRHCGGEQRGDSIADLEHGDLLSHALSSRLIVPYLPIQSLFTR